MRKLSILLAVAALAASTAGCCGRCRNFFHKGNPCGTVMTPAVLSAPMAMSAPPMMAAPNMCAEAQPACVPCCPQQCVPCCPDPCATGMTTGYLGADGCCDGSTMGTYVPGGVPTVAAPATLQPYPGPVSEN